MLRGRVRGRPPQPDARPGVARRPLRVRRPGHERRGGQSRRHLGHGRAAGRGRRPFRGQPARRRPDRGVAHRLHRLLAVGRRARCCTRPRRAGCWCRSRRTPCPTGRSCCPTHPRSRSRWFRAATPAPISTCSRWRRCCTATASPCAAREHRVRFLHPIAAGPISTPAQETALERGQLMSLKRIALRDFVIVRELDLDLAGGFSVLTGETGAGKSILIDALQLALGARAEAGVVREGAARADISAEFDVAARAGALAGASRLRKRRRPAAAPQHRHPGQEPRLDQRQPGHGHPTARTGGPAGRHPRPARLAKPDAARGRARPAGRLCRCRTPRRCSSCGSAGAPRRRPWPTPARRRIRCSASASAWPGRSARSRSSRPGADEWDELNASHTRLANAQSLLEAAQGALQALEGEDGGAAARLVPGPSPAAGAGACRAGVPATSQQVLASSLAQAEDAAHSLHAYLRKTDLDPQRLAELDERMSLWVSLSRRYKRTPAELPALLASWKEELARLDAAADLAALEAAAQREADAYMAEARSLSKARTKAAPQLAKAVTQAMQGLGMQGGRFEVALQKLDAADPGRTGRGRLSGRRARRQHAAAGRQGGVGRRAVAHRAGDRRDHQPPGHGADTDLRRGGCRRRRRRGRNRGPADEAAGARPPGAGRHAPAAGGRLRGPSPGGGQAQRRHGAFQHGGCACRASSGSPRWRACWAAKGCRARPWRMPRRC